MVNSDLGSIAKMECRPNFHIVISEGNLYHNGNKLRESARYLLKMYCDLEQTCDFQFKQELFDWRLQSGTELFIKYACKNDVIEGNHKRIVVTKDRGCPQDSFVQKHIGYFKESRLHPRNDSPAVRRDWELFAMAIAGQARRFRQHMDNHSDSMTYTVFLIYETNKNDFEPTADGKSCQLKSQSFGRSIKYQCRRNNSRWTCTFQGIRADIAKHDKTTGHLL